ncbi:MAG: protein phosphatase 2C domain-containing protein [Pseudomonadota bacterium]
MVGADDYTIPSRTSPAAFPVRSIEVGALTDPGNVRPGNEDAYSVSPDRGLLLVSDGLGGHNAGALASSTVSQRLPELIQRALSSIDTKDEAAIKKILIDSTVKLAGKMWAHAAARPGLAGMGATVVLLLFLDSVAHIAHMGDSRAYLYRKGKLDLLTEDHSVLAILLKSGDVAPDEVRTHPARGMLSRYVGMREEVHPEVRSIGLLPGDRLMLCTDGLTGEVDEADIAAILGRYRDPDEGCTALVNAAKSKGGRDNITVVVADWA